MIKEYFKLTKPGIIFGNVLTTVGGFLLASRGSIHWGTFLSASLGIALVIASGCVFNNYMDRRIDALMARTKNRALVIGTIPLSHALIFASFLGVLGILLLYFGTNFLTAILGMTGFIFYVFIYGYFKRHSRYSTLVGSIPGAIPLVVGYCAVTGVFDISALLLFLTMAVWQMPHFYAISIFRHADYKNAHLPVLSVVSAPQVVKKHIIIFAILYVVFIFALLVKGVTGYVFFTVMIILAIYWVIMGLKGFRNKDTVRWARGMFGFSLITLLMFSLMLSLDIVLH